MKIRLLPIAVLVALVLGGSLRADLASSVRDFVDRSDIAGARQLVEKHRPPQPTAQWLLAASWVARGASIEKQWDVAQQYAQEVYDGSVALLSKRKLDADRDLPLAFGAAIEVLAQAYDAAGDRAAGFEFLARQRQTYRDTSIVTRIQKNILLLGLEGKPLPPLQIETHIGSQPATAAELKGKVVLFFFWAHWCGDCKRQKPILEQLHQAYAKDGLVIVGPTQYYGYIAGGEDATPEQELDYLKNAYQRRYPLPAWMSVPIGGGNFTSFGVSTTPTLVLVDRSGIVRMYHPGDMSREELEAKIRPLLAARQTAVAGSLAGAAGN